MKRSIGHLLVLFAVFSIGYGLGKNNAMQRPTTNSSPPPPHLSGTNRVLVTYFHTTFRCSTCNAIEHLAKQLVEQDYATLIARGALEWHTINFQERDDLARRYELAAGAVVVAKIQNGKEVAFQRLDDVWTLHDNPQQFKRYIEAVINTYLKELNL